jgi:hypothetical protein
MLDCNLDAGVECVMRGPLVPLPGPHCAITDDIRPTRRNRVFCRVLQILLIAGVSLAFVGLVLWLMKLGFDRLEARLAAKRKPSEERRFNSVREIKHGDEERPDSH